MQATKTRTYPSPMSHSRSQNLAAGREHGSESVPSAAAEDRPAVRASPRGAIVPPPHPLGMEVPTAVALGLLASFVQSLGTLVSSCRSHSTKTIAPS